MAVTNKRVIVKSGLANRRTIELLLPRIESIGVEEPALGRLLGYGTVIVRGTGGTPEVCPQMARPLEFRQQVQRQIAGQPNATSATSSRLGHDGNDMHQAVGVRCATL